MFKYLLESQDGMFWLAIIPMLLFLAIFIGIVYKALSKNKEYIEQMSNMPLTDSLSDNSTES
jgi:cbb3-type cytochrome oxidase subunit 3